MSMQDVVAFVNRSDVDAELKQALQSVHGADGVVDLAAECGFTFTREEFDPVVALLGLLQEARTDADLAVALQEAPTPDAIRRLGRSRGYTFTAEVMQHVEIATPAPDGELMDDDLGEVVGGAAVQIQNSLRVSLQSTRPKTSTAKSFSEVAASGLSKAADTTMSVGQVAAPFVPGGSVLSAAMSG